MAFMRASKFRHVFGKPLRKDQCYDNIRITKSSWDSTFCCVNPKFVAIITEAAGGGAFLVLPVNKVGRVERDVPLVAGHKAAVLDINWCPHNDQIIASASEDCTVKIWEIPDEGLVKNLTESVVDLVAHQRRVGQVIWHPTANNVLLSAGSDNKIFIWNVATAEVLTEIDTPDLTLSASFNYNGSKLVVTNKDKMMRLIDPRTGEITAEVQAHHGAKPSQAVYLKEGKIFTTGFSRMSERQYALWDEKDLSKPLVMEEIDNSNGVIFPFYDADTSMVYLCGKGDSLIRYYEVTEDAPYVHYLNLYQSSDPQRGIGYMPKRGLNVNACEIARFYKLLNSGLCEIIPFTVPRKSELFQDDLYPDTAGDIPAISAEDWHAGKNAEPILISLKDGYKTVKKEGIKAVKKSDALTKMPTKKPASSTTTHDHGEEASEAASSGPAHQPENAKPVPSGQVEGFDSQALLEDIRKLKLIVKAHERRIKTLEDKLSQYEANSPDEEDQEDQA
ncbi:hypothetical protein ACJMK2_011285 [Sinanodonta woodiana]|uniref:Coronin n=1 Tax=Sinanodonta woodiana TaxID=1069815 RepID=A0ABD3V6C2_SINWO